MPVSSTHDNDNPLFSKPIQPTESFDAHDPSTRPKRLARINSLDGPIINRGTLPYVSFTVFRSVVSLRHEVRIYI